MIYVLYGENDIEIDKYIDGLVKKNSIDTVIKYSYKETKVKSVLEECSYTDLFGNKKLVVMYEADFLTGSTSLNDEALLDYINMPNEDVIFVLKSVTEKLDERKKVVKLLKEKAKVIEFKLLNEKTLKPYVDNYFKTRKYYISVDAVDEIARRLGPNSKAVDKELEKLLLYRIDKKEISLSDVKCLVTKYEENNAFKLVDALIDKDKGRVFTLYKKLKEEKEEPVKLLTLLANNFRLILSCQILINDGFNKYKITSLLKEHPYRVELAINNSFSIDREELKRIIKLLGSIDYKIKTGSLDKYQALEEFFIKM